MSVYILHYFLLIEKLDNMRQPSHANCFDKKKIKSNYILNSDLLEIYFNLKSELKYVSLLNCKFSNSYIFLQKYIWVKKTVILNNSVTSKLIY